MYIFNQRNVYKKFSNTAGMTTKSMPMGIRPNQPRFDGFSPILKYEYGTGNGDICTHPEPIPKPYPNVERSCFCLC